ncbi:MAG: glycosyltransferase [Chloroflexi bacterium]|jgi:glycosyltransferase involved in cell wall biosynthesis|nr:glycosyltransferase [Chloroflexota bacterium]
MDILHVVHGYFPALGGSERLIQRISENLVDRFNDHVTVCTANGYNTEAFVDPSQPLLPPGEFDLNGVHVRRFPVFNRLGRVLFPLQEWAYRLGLPGNQYLRTWYGGPIIPGLRRYVENFSGDVVAATAFPLLHMYTTLRGCKCANTPIVFHGALHPLNDWGFNRPMIYKAISQADAYIANSDYERTYLVESHQICPEKISVIGVGVDVDRFERADGGNVRQSHDLDDHLLVAFIGQQGRNKGIDTLILSMKDVWLEMPEVRLLIAGAKTHFTSQLQNMICTQLSPSEQDHIIYLHNFAEEEKPDLFAACDVFAYPSRYESFGISFIEAWAAGKPVVGCRAGAVPSVVSDGVDGLLVPMDNPIALGKTLLHLLKFPDLRRQLGQAGREKVLRRYTWEIVTSRWRRVYERVLS